MCSVAGWLVLGVISYSETRHNGCLVPETQEQKPQNQQRQSILNPNPKNQAKIWIHNFPVRRPAPGILKQLRVIGPVTSID